MDQSLSWLTDLDRKVEAAIRQLGDLREENRQFRDKIKRLQEQLSQARGEQRSAGDWQKERQAVRRRVEKLADSLENML